MSKSGGKMPDGLPQGFPAGLRVLVVDDDRVVLRTLEAMLLQCGYKVTLADHAMKALEMLRANKNEYDIVITDVSMPDMDGFKLLEIIGLEMDLPVIMLSVDCGFESVMKGLEHGAVGHLSKPARLEELKLIWTHVVKKSLGEKNDPKHSGSSLDHASKQLEEVQNLRPSRKSKDRRNEKDEEEESESEDDYTTQKRARVSWTKELHAKFIDAVKFLGIDRAVPKKILDIMQIPGLTRENVASHLQKYRKGLKKNAMGLSEQLFDGSGTSGHGGSSMSMAMNKQLPSLCSFDRSTGHRNISLVSPYLQAHESRHIPAVGTSTWFPPPLRPQINLSRQYTMNSHGSQLGTQQLGFGRNSYMMKMPNQLPGYQPHTPNTSRLNFNANPCSGDGNTGSNSVQPPGYMLDQQAQTNGLLDSNCSIEIDAILAFEREQQLQFACVPIFDSEMGDQIHRNSLDSVNHEDHRGNRPSDVTEFTDDLHVALKQFQR